MKILHLSRNFIPCVGGTEKYIAELSRRLVQRGLDSRVLVLNYDIFDKRRKFPGHEWIEGTEVFRVPGLGHYKKPVPLGLPLRLFRWADIVHIHDLRLFYETTLFLKPFFRYKTCLSTHGFLLHTNELKVLKTALTRLYYRPTFKRGLNAVICDSRQDYDYFRPWGIARLFLIENGIDLAKFHSIGPDPVPGRLLYFGRIDHNKGLDLMLRALGTIKGIDWDLRIVGSGQPAFEDKLKSLAQESGIVQKISWLGFLPEDALRGELARAHLCLLPSRYEGFGFTLLEAMASGLVCLANTIPTYRSIIRDGENGFLADFSRPQECGRTIREVLGRPLEALPPVRSKARGKASEYDWEKKVDEVIQVYRGEDHD
ncbi:MAG: glycosyltransferase family 4 protein [Candidatus Aminicenantes bacterium]|nr:glycosyltransferase family 4 protein [Candidatus Aminicenantes bacterium]